MYNYLIEHIATYRQHVSILFLFHNYHRLYPGVTVLMLDYKICFDISDRVRRRKKESRIRQAIM